MEKNEIFENKSSHKEVISCNPSPLGIINSTQNLWRQLISFIWIHLETTETAKMHT